MLNITSRTHKKGIQLTNKAIYISVIAIMLAGCGSAPPVKSAAELEVQKEQQQQILSQIQYRSQDDFVKDINEIIKSKVEKSSLETTQEFATRKNSELRKYERNGYSLSFKIDNSKNSKDSLVYFEPDQSKLFVTMPKREKEIVWLGPKNDQLLWLHISYLNVKNLSGKIDSYVAQNSFGAKKDITRIRKEGIGIAILNSVGNYQAKPQTFMMNVDRQVAAEILKSGRLELNVFVDTQYSSVKKETILTESGEVIEPNMNYPLDIKTILHGLPVRLVSLKLYDGNEKKIGEWQGQQIFASAISRD